MSSVYSPIEDISPRFSRKSKAYFSRNIYIYMCVCVCVKINRQLIRKDIKKITHLYIYIYKKVK